MRPARFKLRKPSGGVLRLALALGVAMALVAVSGATGSAAGSASGLVAAYAFDDGSGSVLSDASGNGHDGTISGATWTSGHDGGALSFNGSNASVDLGSLGTFYQSGFTLEGWVQKQTSTKKDVGVLGSWSSSGGPMLWVDHLAGDYQLTLNSGLSSYLDSGHTPIGGQWQYLAATFDGSTARFYIDGVQVASRSVTSSVGSSNNWRIGAYGSVAGGFFDGLIDNVRIYNRALSDTEVQTDMSVPVTTPTGPSAPGGLSVTARTQTSVSLQWNPSTGGSGIAGYHVFLNGAQVGTATTTTSFSFTGLSCSTSYQLGVEAFDTNGNTSGRTVQDASTSLCDAPSGLVAAYAFDETSGSVLHDSSGNGHDGTISGATWTSGHDGGALSFNGSNASVDLGSLGTFYQSGFTLEGWVQKQTSTKKDVGVLGSWSSSGGPMLWVDHLAGDYQLTLNSGLSSYLDSGHTPIGGQWQYLAATFDGSTARFYIDGVQVASRSVTSSVGSSNNWRIGAYGSVAGGFFDGLIDNVRIYNRALSDTEVQTDMSLPAPAAGVDTAAPSAPGTPTVSVDQSRVTLSWAAASDNVGVTRYDVYRSTSSGFTPSVGNRIAQPTGLSYTDAGLAIGTYYYKVQAEDAAGNIGPASSEISATVLPDTTPPTAPTNLAPSVNGGTVNLTWSPSTDDVAVTRYDVYRGTSAGFTPTAANRIAQPAGTSYGDSGLTAGSYYYKVTAEDAAGNMSGPSNETQATIADTSPPSTPSSLSATVVGTTVNLSWAASTDNIGVLRYNLYRGTSAGFTPSAANRIAQPVTTLYQDIGLAAGTYYYKLTAEDAAGNVSPLSNEVSAVSPDMTPPSAPATLTAVGGAGQASLSWSPASDNVGVTRYDLYRSTTSGFTPSVSNRIAQPTGLGYIDSGLAAGELLLPGAGRGCGREPLCLLERGKRAGHQRRSARPAGGVRLRRERPVRVLCAGFLGELQNGDAQWRQLDDLRPKRGSRFAQRHEQRGRPTGARHLLQEGVHARGLGVQADQQGRCRGRRELAREPKRRPDDLGRQCLGALPADAWSDVRELPRFRRHPCNRSLATRRRRVRRVDRAHLHRRDTCGELDLHGQRRRFEHVANRRLRLAGGQLLRRPDRRREDLQPGSQRQPGPGRHGQSGPA